MPAAWGGRRLVSALLSAACVFGSAMPALAQDSADEEAAYYKQSDPPPPPPPGAPVTPVAPAADLHTHSFTLTTGLFVGMSGGMGADDTGTALEFRWLWSPFDAALPVRVEFGIDAGWVSGPSYGEGPHTPQGYLDSDDVASLGFALAPTHPFTDVVVELGWMYGGIASRVDFTGPMALDVGLAMSVRYALIQVDAEWHCTDCSGIGPQFLTSDFSETNLVIRAGGFVGYQVAWFAFGIDAGFQFFLKDDHPMQFGVDVGLTLGVGF